MSDKINFLDAGLDEIIYRIPDPAKIKLYSDKLNLQEFTKGPKRTVILYKSIPESFDKNSFDDFFQKFMNAIKRSAEDTALISVETSTMISFQQIAKLQSAQQLIAFGISPARLGLHIETEKYQIAELCGMKILFADAVEELDKVLKSKLWGQLKPMFDLT